MTAISFPSFTQSQRSFPLPSLRVSTCGKARAINQRETIAAFAEQKHLLVTRLVRRESNGSEGGRTE
jgi:hypothetical protein